MSSGELHARMRLRGQFVLLAFPIRTRATPKTRTRTYKTCKRRLSSTSLSPTHSYPEPSPRPAKMSSSAKQPLQPFNLPLSLLRHGSGLIGFGLLFGFVVPLTPYPRLGLTAHIQFAV